MTSTVAQVAAVPVAANPLLAGEARLARGRWHKPAADRFAKIVLSTGNETDRAEAYPALRGRDADIDALLKKRGHPIGTAR